MAPVQKKLKTDNRVNEILKLLKSIQNCEINIGTVSEQCKNEVRSISKKFSQVEDIYFNKRAEIISKIPHFWFIAFSNHQDLGYLLEEDEVEDCFHHLIKIEVEEFKAHAKQLPFKINFYFEENPYFENKILTKVFKIFAKTVFSYSIPVKWKEGKNLIENNGPTRVRSGSKRRLNQMNFFTWYNDNMYPATDNIAKIIRYDLWYNPASNFLDSYQNDDAGNQNDDASDDASNQSNEAHVTDSDEDDGAGNQNDDASYQRNNTSDASDEVSYQSDYGSNQSNDVSYQSDDANYDEENQEEDPELTSINCEYDYSSDD